MAARQVREDIPETEIAEICTKYDKVLMRVQRRNGRGQLQTLSASINMETDRLPMLEDWLQAFAGGGQYEIEIKDPTNPSTVIVPRFKVPLEGAPRPPKFLGSPENQTHYPADPYSNSYSNQQPPQQQEGQVFTPPAGAWAQNLHPQQQQQYGGGRVAPRPAPGATVASDQMAMRQHAEYKAETAKQIAKMEAQIERLIDDNKRQAELLAAERDRAREERHKSELQRIEQMLKLQMEHKPQPVESKGTADMIAALAPFAPVFAAMVTSKESSSSKSLEVQQQGLTTLMNATLSQANKPDSTSEMIKTLLPMALPFITQMMDAKSPAAQAAMFNNMVENNLSQVAMMAQLIESFASSGGEQEPWWLPMIKETLGGVVGMTEAYMQSSGLPGQLPAQPAPQRLPAPQAAQTRAAAAPAGFAGASYTTDDEPEEVIEVQPDLPNPERAKARAERAAQESMTGIKAGQGIEGSLSVKEKVMLSMLPDAFQTHEWRAIIIAIERGSDVDEVADIASAYIIHLINFNLLPDALQDVVEDPARALDRVLAPLPATKHNPEYTAALINKVIDELIDAEAVMAPPSLAETEVPVQAEEAAPATPAAPAAQA